MERRAAPGRKLEEHRGASAAFCRLPRDQEVIVYCGSGISACPNVLALKRAGFKQVTLYAGSWSDWSSRSGYPVETGHPSQ
ncbi:sulfurtransferase [Shouchella clausii]|uniref:sulfurtransferase n=1 Tax=Shouchella clausii TaxID=79880 RepID=UPI00399D5C53